MASRHNFRNHQRPTFLEDVGNKVRQGIEIAGTAKGLYEAGKFLYHTGRAIAPYVGSALAVA